MSAADGSPEEPLYADVPRDDLEHHTTPRDLRAAHLATLLEGRTGHRDPNDIADRLILDAETRRLNIKKENAHD